MKAALNGVPSFSVLDGWWVEGCFEGVTGWAIGEAAGKTETGTGGEIESMYQKLEDVILPMFYQHPDSYAEVMRSAIAVNASFFNTQRMLAQYNANAYFPETLAEAAERAIAVDSQVSVPEIDEGMVSAAVG